MKFIKRTALSTVRELSGQFPAIMVCGARQVGKTTLLREAAEDGRKFVSLDDPDIRAMARNDPVLFLQTYTPPVIIDEIQYAPQLLPIVKMAIDRDSDKCGRFWFTGSQQFHLMQDIGESLAGRIIEYRTLNGSFSNPEELMNVPGIGTTKYEKILNYIITGG